MNATDERQRHAVASVLQARGATLPPEGLPASVILDSWARCVQAGLDPAAQPRLEVVEAGDLRARQERAAIVRRLAQAELETLSQQIAGSNFLLAFADQEGVILDLYADNRFQMSGSGAGIVAGSRWTEALCGTNGLGTALATGHSVAVTGLEHYFLGLGDISCTATPVRDAHGAVVGVLDASSYFESRQRHTQALVQMAATHIENGLLLHQMSGHTVLAIHPRAEYLGTLSAGLLAFDGAARLVAANARARTLLAGLQASHGTPFEDLFGEPYELAVARLVVGQEVRMRDNLGSSLVARVVVRPPARLLRGASQAVAAAPSQVPAARVPAPAGPEPGFVCEDAALRRACALVREAVRMKAPVLLSGETGCGKEMMARYAHEASGRRGAFVAVNCGALTEELFEAELFGHVPGAYTGARREGGPGLIASADGGTLLLDEVRELPLPLQAALLRFLDDGMVRPVGGTAARHVDVQLLAATHASLEEEVAQRRFRADLLYRLNVVKVSLTPLRAREDFAQAAHGVLATLDSQARLDDAAVQRLAGHTWPGNFRELRSVLTRALLARRQAGGAPVLGPLEIDEALGALGALGGIAAAHPARASTAVPASAPETEPARAPGAPTLRHIAADAVRQEFARSGGSVSLTARRLGISRTTVYRHLREPAAQHPPR
ncbi:MAG: sigma-54-dependent Fis family transcriptional regulator [Rubrivivax sp.]